MRNYALIYTKSIKEGKPQSYKDYGDLSDEDDIPAFISSMIESIFEYTRTKYVTISVTVGGKPEPLTSSAYMLSRPQYFAVTHKYIDKLLSHMFFEIRKSLFPDYYNIITGDIFCETIATIRHPDILPKAIATARDKFHAWYKDERRLHEVASSTQKWKDLPDDDISMWRTTTLAPFFSDLIDFTPCSSVARQIIGDKLPEIEIIVHNYRKDLQHELP